MGRCFVYFFLWEGFKLKNDMNPLTIIYISIHIHAHIYFMLAAL